MYDKTGFELIDKAYKEDLEKARKKIRANLVKEIREGKNPNFTKGHTDWMLAKYPYGTEKQRGKAINAEDEKRRRQQEAFEQEVEKRLSEKQPQLEQAHFGKDGREFALEQAGREEKIKEFKQTRQERQEREKKERNRTTEQSKARGEALVKEQKDNRAAEQDNSRQINMRPDFNNETQKGKAKTDAQLKIDQFKERQRQAMKSDKDQDRSKDQAADNPEPKKNSIYLQDDFNRAHSKQEIEDWQDGKPPTHEKEESRESKEQGFKERMRESHNTEGKEQSTDLEPEM